MTHLVIEQPTTGIEQVSSSVIEKLYNLAVSGDLDASSNLQGRLSVDGTYQEYIDELEGQFDELYITANKIYINFADDAVKSALMSVYGDGIGITSSDVSTTYINKSFKNNTSIHTFDELSQFTGVNYLTDQQFSGCTNLTSIDTSRISRVGNNCITDTKITHLDLSNLTTISGPNAFTGNTLLTSVDFGQNSSLTALGSTAFGGCTSLQTITIPTTITTIPNYCFYNDSNLTTISGTSNVTSIGGAAFENCSKLTTIDISSVTALAWNSFKGCSKLNNITLNSGLTSIPSSCFKGCSTLSSIDLSNVTSIGASAFEGCTSLTSIDLSNVTSIGQASFEGCIGLTGELIIGNNITSIGYTAFKGSGYSKVTVTNTHITALDNPSNAAAFGNMPNIQMANLIGATGLTKVSECVVQNSTKNSNTFQWLLLPSSITQLGSDLCFVTPRCRNVVLPVLVTDLSTMNYNQYAFNDGISTVYVPDQYLTDYTTSTAFSSYASHFKGMSELPNEIKTLYGMSTT